MPGIDTIQGPQPSTCIVCNKAIQEGKAYEVRGSAWHEQCFNCSHCHRSLCQSKNFLCLDSNHVLICPECSAFCSHCGKMIGDKAIILSNNESFCPDCFKCSRCDSPIHDLKYSKSPKGGILCLNCHQRTKNSTSMGKQHVSTSPSTSVSAAVLPKRSEMRPQGVDKYYLQRKTSSHRQSKSLSSASNARSSTADTVANSTRSGTIGTADTDEQQKVPAESRQDPQKNHTRSVSLDAMLNSTLENDGFSGEEAGDEQGSASFAVTPPHSPKVGPVLPDTASSNSFARQDTPSAPTSLDLPDTSTLLKTPELKHSPDDKHVSNLPLNSPMATENRNGFPSSIMTLPSSSTVQNGLALNFSQGLINNKSMDSSLSGANNNQGKPASNNDKPFRLAPKEKKPGRSLSLKSKNFFSPWKHRGSISNQTTPKTPKMPSSPPTSSTNFKDARYNTTKPDTHSGWGVSGTSTSLTISNPILQNNSSQPEFRRPTRGQSDTLIYNGLNHPQGGKHFGTLPTSHKHQVSTGTLADSNKGNHTSKVAMFTTPPLENSITFKQLSNTVLAPVPKMAHSDEDDLKKERSFTKDNSSGSLHSSVPSSNRQKTNDVEAVDEENIHSELACRKLKLELKSMQVTKKQLSIDIENLRLTKQTLLEEITYLKLERDKSDPSGPPPIEEPTAFNVTASVPNITATPVGNSGLQTTPNKPKFWKIFGSGGNGKDLQIPARDRHNGMNLSDHSLSNSDISAHGSGLADICQREGNKVPRIIQECIDFIESDKNHLEAEGIYRKSGSITLIEELERRLYQEGGHIQRGDDIHVVTNVLKRFLRRLPDPVISVNIYTPLISLVRNNDLIKTAPLNGAQGGDDHDIALIRFVKDHMIELMDRLPLEHYELLRILIKHLNTVALYDKFNLMNLHNLAVVFAPSIIHDVTGERDVADLNERNFAMEFMLLYKVI
ncbi:GTPase-activating protein RGA2 KNAG_0C04810 [Huiozyma naganishii CBS 8797]|uniref:Rho-GAP domain-containing protein n=1 Tax=Huiozyma naganishii (strain ATCC MYA-139 / BCRC 22969 / CBS 8797 / KCTC 17520 / NBRC 10181 / NCYC 3082 / Yp74L-3) TaxID=1071383 RepID=J7RX17_HUIN7|nr:hypothetical protein KNAG_0C04810 [Kazachstania naganishii CBS 8797]CCK69582.1 hypothetical protein KNAG_0C04810 [Kazachstania naganishii CBS 8797]